MNIRIRNEASELTELGVRSPVCSLIRSKAGVSLYRVESEGKKLILKVFEKQENTLWKVITEKYSTIRSRIDALPRTLTYNDFYWTNLIVSKTGEYAFMFDYNLLGKGIAYGDIRNVVSSLSCEAAEAFIQEYGDDIAEEQKKADAFIAPLVTLVNACSYDAFPFWAEDSLEELKNGFILRHLKEWLGMEVSYMY